MSDVDAVGRGLPASGHELLLWLAGQVDDDLLAIGRELVAVGEEAAALELIVASLAAARTALPQPVRDGLVDIVERRLGPALARMVPPGVPPAGTTGHRFTPDCGVPEAAEQIAAMVTDLPMVARSGARAALTWRLTPAGAAPGPLPHPVVLLVLSDPSPAEVLAYQVGATLGRAGVAASVEAFVDGPALPPYQRAALAASWTPRPAAPDAARAGRDGTDDRRAGVPSTDPRRTAWPVALDAPMSGGGDDHSPGSGAVTVPDGRPPSRVDDGGAVTPAVPSSPGPPTTGSAAFDPAGFGSTPPEHPRSDPSRPESTDPLRSGPMSTGSALPGPDVTDRSGSTFAPDVTGWEPFGPPSRDPAPFGPDLLQPATAYPDPTRSDHTDLGATRPGVSYPDPGHPDPAYSDHPRPGPSSPGPGHSGPAHTDPALSGRTHSDPAHPGPAHTEPALSGPAHTDPARSGPAHTDAAHPDPARTDPAHPGPPHTETFLSGPTHTDPARHGPAHTDPAHPGPAHTETALSGPAHTDPARPGPAEPGPGHTGPASREPAHPDLGYPGPGWSGAAYPGHGRPDPTSVDPAEPDPAAHDAIRPVSGSGLPGSSSDDWTAHTSTPPPDAARRGSAEADPPADPASTDPGLRRSEPGRSEPGRSEPARPEPVGPARGGSWTEGPTPFGSVPVGPTVGAVPVEPARVDPAGNPAAGDGQWADAGTGPARTPDGSDVDESVPTAGPGTPPRPSPTVDPGPAEGTNGHPSPRPAPRRSVRPGPRPRPAPRPSTAGPDGAFPGVDGGRAPDTERAWADQWSDGSWSVPGGARSSPDPDIEPATSPNPTSPPLSRVAPSPVRRTPEESQASGAVPPPDVRPRHRLDAPEEPDSDGAALPDRSAPPSSAVPDDSLDSRLTPNEQELLRRLQEELAARERGGPGETPRNGAAQPSDQSD